MGRVEESLRVADEIIQELTEQGTETIRLRAMGLKGNALRHLARYAEAEETLRSALDYAIENFGETHEETSAARNHLGILYKYTGNFDEAERLYRAALGYLPDKESSLAAALYHNLGGLAHARGDFAGGEADARKAWEINRRLLGEDHPTTLADAAAYAGVLDGLGRYEESEPIYRRALEAFERIYGPEHYEIVVNLNNLANVRYARGDSAEAEELFRRSLAIKEKTLGTNHPDTALTANNLGVLLHSLGRKEEARALFEHALKVFEAQLDGGHPHVKMARDNLVAAASAPE
ncbi:MAG: hypothetical protein HFACDABA_00863 [Anaerolineales bacterium]|nr:hypothetical protein [Anaerolineales bacterium]